MANSTENHDHQIESLLRAQSTLEAILAECRAAGYDGSITLVEFIKTRLQAK